MTDINGRAQLGRGCGSSRLPSGTLPQRVRSASGPYFGFQGGAMGNCQDPLIEKLIEKLHHKDPIVRRNAAAALRLHGPRAVAALGELAKLIADEDPRVRTEVGRALQRLRSLAA